MNELKIVFWVVLIAAVASAVMEAIRAFRRREALRPFVYSLVGLTLAVALFAVAVANRGVDSSLYYISLGLLD